MEGPTTSERDERTLSGVDSPFDAHAAQRPSHRCIDDGNDRPGGCLTTRADPSGQRVDRRDRAADVELHAIAHGCAGAVSYTHLRAHETPEHLVCRLLLEKKKN